MAFDRIYAERPKTSGATPPLFRPLPPAQGIFEWAIPTQRLPGITTPLPPSAHQDARTHEASLAIGHVHFEFVPDAQMTPAEARAKGRAETGFHLSYTTPALHEQGGHIDAFQPPPDLVVRVQTRYPPGWNPDGRSGYGRGTTREDVAAGDSSLRFHEGRHGADYLRFAREHPAPQFAGRVGMTIPEFRAAVAAYERAIDAYIHALEDYSLRSTDCVGTTIDDFNRKRGDRRVRCAR
jgi:hypothetical protein